MIHPRTRQPSDSLMPSSNLYKRPSQLMLPNLCVQLGREVAGLTLVVPSLIPSTGAKRSVGEEELFDGQ